MSSQTPRAKTSAYLTVFALSYKHVQLWYIYSTSLHGSVTKSVRVCEKAKVVRDCEKLKTVFCVRKMKLEHGQWKNNQRLGCRWKLRQVLNKLRQLFGRYFSGICVWVSSRGDQPAERASKITFKEYFRKMLRTKWKQDGQSDCIIRPSIDTSSSMSFWGLPLDCLCSGAVCPGMLLWTENEAGICFSVFYSWERWCSL